MFSVNLLCDSTLNDNERQAAIDALSEVHRCFSDHFFSSDFKMRIYRNSDIFLGQRRFHADATIAKAMAYPGKPDRRGVKEPMFDVEDLARIFRINHPFRGETGVVVLVTARTIVKVRDQGGLERLKTFYDDGILIVSISSFREEKLLRNDAYLVVKLVIQREIGEAMGVFEKRRENVAWNCGELVCTSPLCVMNRAVSTIQHMGLARKTDSKHVVFCPTCIRNVKLIHHTPIEETQS